MPRHRRALPVLLSFAWLLPGICLPGQAATAGQFLYVVTCDARVDKLDTITGRKMETYDLAKRTGKESLVPVVGGAQGALDSCLASQSVYDRAASTFSTVVPISNEPKADGTKDYRVLSFSVPRMELVKQDRGGESLDAPPHLELQSGTLKILKPSEWMPQTSLDLSAYGPDKTQTPNQILESSGDRALLRLFTADDKELLLAVADRNTQKLVRLQGVPTTVAPCVHIVPGGGHVLIEETGTGDKPGKTGRLVLFDALTGKQQKELNDSHIKDLYFLAVSPTGRVIYHSNDNYWFVHLKMKFASAPVSRPISKGYPDFFFASK
jgi:hypothetical protein